MKCLVSFHKWKVNVTVYLQTVRLKARPFLYHHEECPIVSGTSLVTCVPI